MQASQSQIFSNFFLKIELRVQSLFVKLTSLFDSDLAAALFGIIAFRTQEDKKTPLPRQKVR
jgi:hypothetical protein